MDQQVGTLSIILSQIYAGGSKITPPTGLWIGDHHIAEAENGTFLKQRSPKSSFLKKNSRFNLFDDGVDTLSFILSPKFWMWDRNEASYRTWKWRESYFGNVLLNLLEKKAPQKPPFLKKNRTLIYWIIY